ncbi:DUF2971 domain-containing protein [Paenibacillus sp. NPDC056579]|uniref:DUF2971 domain-containing protein n=1 Tax=Paenibacillus sp. NPDC056579 TaxID=3345871 RepID=UPI003697DE7D
MYRFRSVKNLIGEYQELEKQQIYFASLDELNDPMEGTRRYFWQGDRIVWENLLKHYLLCLEHVIFQTRLLPDNKTITKKDIPIYKSEKDLPTDRYKDRIQRIKDHFFSDRFVQSYLQFIICNPNKIYLEEMYVHLKILSGNALKAIIEIDAQSGLIPYIENTQTKELENTIGVDFPSVGDELYENQYGELIEFLFGVLKSWDNELLQMYIDNPKLQSVSIEFPQMYLDSVVELTYPKAYVACFMDNCSNSSIWGTYGNNHTGVCLKFKTVNSESNPLLPLKTIVGYSSRGNMNDYRDFPLQPIEYTSDFNELDFFRNIGRIPMQQLEEQWYTGENGELSICGEHIFSNVEEWRNQHWSAYQRAYLKKIPDWRHEREYRIILSSSIGLFDKPGDRLLEYKFNNLEAIIFGMKTPKEAKAEIIQIVKRKCEEIGRKEFEFYEMEYSIRKKELYPRKIVSLKTSFEGEK